MVMHRNRRRMVRLQTQEQSGSAFALGNWTWGNLRNDDPIHGFYYIYERLSREEGLSMDVELWTIHR